MSTEDKQAETQPVGWQHPAAFAAALAGLLAAFYFPWLFQGKSFYVSDLTYYFEPFCRSLAEALAARRLPLWNPHLYCGMPQIAVPSPGAFYPPNWMFAFMPFSQGLALSLALHQTAAGLGGYMLIAGLGWGTAAASVCGLVLALSGYMLSLSANFTLVFSAAWLPLAGWALLHVGPGAGSRNLLLVTCLSLLVFLLLAAGRPEVSLPGIALLVLVAAVDALMSLRSGHARKAVLSAAFWRLVALAAGVALAMPVILPAAEWFPLSTRAAGMNKEEVLRWSANWYDLLCMAASQPLGDLSTLGGPLLSLVATRPGFIPYLPSAYVGPVALTLALWGAWGRGWIWRWPVLVVLAASIVMALGKNTPVFPWLLDHFDFLAIFRYPVKLLIVPVWCVALLAGRGVYLACRSQVGRAGIAVAMTLWAAALAGGVAMITVPATGSVLLGAEAAGSPPGINTATAMIGQSLLRSSVVALAVCALAFLRARARVSGHSFAVIVVSALAATLLATAFLFCRHPGPADFFQVRSHAASELDRLRRGGQSENNTAPRVLPLYFDPLTCPGWYRTRYERQDDSSWFYRYGRDLILPNTNLDAGVPVSMGYEAAETADHRRIFRSNFRSSHVAEAYARMKNKPASKQARSDLPLARFCALTASAYVLTQAFVAGREQVPVPRLDGELFEPMVDDPVMNLRIWRVRSTLPRAYLSSSWEVVSVHSRAVDAVAHPLRSGFDPARKTLVEPFIRFAGAVPAVPEKKPAAAGEAYVKVLQDRPEHVALSVKTPAPALVVLADQFYPGWEARLDGLPTDLHRANAIQRALFVGPGSHLVEFDYRPQSLAAGKKCAVAALALLLGLILLVIWRWFWALAKAQSSYRG